MSMPDKITSWIKENKLTTILILTVGYFFYLQLSQMQSQSFYEESYVGRGGAELAYDAQILPSPGYGGSTNVAVAPEDRMVVTNSYLSLLVENVSESIGSIKSQAESLGGFMVSSSITTPEGLTNGDITIRIPRENLDQMQSYLRGLAVRVVTENTSGYDITDEYTDIEERLGTLEATKAKYEQILDSATEVDEILRVTEALIQVQDQIDYWTGRAEYLSETSETTLITVYLSTDEFELPYAPEQPWRPEVIFKTAVRSLISGARLLGTVTIWFAVYAAVLVPIFVIIRALSGREKRK